eukprot:jgi/Ulvmu1/8721/UM047_0062.1
MHHRLRCSCPIVSLAVGRLRELAACPAANFKLTRANSHSVAKGNGRCLSAQAGASHYHYHYYYHYQHCVRNVTEDYSTLYAVAEKVGGHAWWPSQNSGT